MCGRGASHLNPKERGGGDPAFSREDKDALIDRWRLYKTAHQRFSARSKNNALAALSLRTAGHHLSTMMDENEDPRAPYKVYEGDELKGTYATRAEARWRQQQLESEHSNRHFIIKDRNGDIAV